jgi:hypothetical protein
LKHYLTISSLNDKPFIRIIGKYLRKFGFETGDKIQLEIKHNKIIITNMTEENELFAHRVFVIKSKHKKTGRVSTTHRQSLYPKILQNYCDELNEKYKNYEFFVDEIGRNKQNEADE